MRPMREVARLGRGTRLWSSQVEEAQPPDGDGRDAAALPQFALLRQYTPADPFRPYNFLVTVQGTIRRNKTGRTGYMAALSLIVTLCPQVSLTSTVNVEGSVFCCSMISDIRILDLRSST